MLALNRFQFVKNFLKPLDISGLKFTLTGDSGRKKSRTKLAVNHTKRSYAETQVRAFLIYENGFCSNVHNFSSPTFHSSSKKRRTGALCLKMSFGIPLLEEFQFG